MEHVVFFPAHDGSPAFRRTASLEEAVGLVEHLRNVEGVDGVTVHSLTEVPLAFKAYYRVEMPMGDGPVGLSGSVSASAPAQPEVVVPQQEQPAPVPVEAVATAEPVQAQASLGFFAR